MSLIFNLCPRTTSACTETMSICNFFKSLQICVSQKYKRSSHVNTYVKLQPGRKTEPLSTSPTVLFIQKLKLSRVKNEFFKVPPWLLGLILPLTTFKTLMMLRNIWQFLSWKPVSNCTCLQLNISPLPLVPTPNNCGRPWKPLKDMVTCQSSFSQNSYVILSPPHYLFLR